MSTPTELNASAKHSCPACGAEAVWNPAKQALVCAFCGTSAPMENQSGSVLEHDLVSALRSIPDDQRGWAAEKTSVRCKHCQAISVFDPGKIGQRCDFCGSSELIPYEEVKSPFRPESLLPLKISESQVRDNLKRWLKSVWFAPNNLSKLSSADTVRACYLPFWTFDAQVHAHWTAEAGYHYYVDEEYTDSQNNRRTRQVQHTRWEPASGSLQHFFDDELISASRGVNPALIEKVGPFPTAEATPYDPAFLAGWTVEHYQIDLIDAARQARGRMDGQVRSLCSSQVPGDTHRGLSVSSNYSAQTFKHILAPIWLMTYVYRGSPYQVLANGVTGKVAGQYPKSWVKITVAIFVLLAVIGVIVALANGHS